MAAERSRSPSGGSPVPACMFAPEPGSPPAAFPARSAALRGCEALNGDTDIDLTSKVSPRPPQPRGLRQCPL